MFVVKNSTTWYGFHLYRVYIRVDPAYGGVSDVQVEQLFEVARKLGQRSMDGKNYGGINRLRLCCKVQRDNRLWRELIQIYEDVQEPRREVVLVAATQQDKSAFSCLRQAYERIQSEERESLKRQKLDHDAVENNDEVPG